jgi:hypothetical protein
MNNWLDKYENGGSFLGTTNVGRDYSPAWGGQFDMGGSLPGSVGFTYARTGDIPDNGKYAKKTLASAQNGKEMQFYQQGLDFQPKTISQDGTRVAPRPRPLTETEWQENKRISEAQKIATEKHNKQILEERQKARNTKGTFKEKNFNIGEKFRMFPGSVGGAGELFDDYINPLKFVGDMASNLGNSRTPQEAALNVAMTAGLGAIGFDPLGSALKSPALKNAAKTVVDLPRAKNIKEAIGRIGGIPLNADIPRMGIDDVKALRQVQEIGRLRATNVPYTGQMKYALENKLPEEHFQKVFGRSKEEAQLFLNSEAGEQSVGRSSSIDLTRPSRRAEADRYYRHRDVLIRYLEDQPSIHYGEERVANIIGEGADDLGGAINFRALSDEQLSSLRTFATEQNALLRQMDPSLSESLDWDMTDISSAINNVERSSANIDRSTQVRSFIESLAENNQLAAPPEYLNLNLDVPYSASGNIASRTKNPMPVILERLNTGMRNIDNKLENLFMINSQNYPYHSGTVNENVSLLTLANSGNLKNVSKKVSSAPQGMNSGDVFTGSTNTSHSSYLPQLKQVFKYDKGDPQFLGYKPMNTMGFLSNFEYEASDIAKYLNSEIDEQIKRGIIPKDIQRPFLKNESVILPHYGVKQYKQGGIIKDDRGQWAHPGEITQIDSNNITMQGVPYPVLGIGADGEQMMMQPGEDYKFNKGPVTEYPMMKSGGNINNLDAQPIEKLDQLTNFTNYNKPTKGGWLDKYQ